VPAITLADVARNAGLSRIDHVKMDIESAEYEVLRSSDEFIRRYRPTFVVEIHRDERGIINAAAVANLFERLGYRVARIKQSEGEIFPLLHCWPEPPQAN
jgi:hypothetical protein